MRRRRRRRQIGVLVDRPRIDVLPQQRAEVAEEAAVQIGVRRRDEADRVREARPLGDTVMRDARRQVQHVARLQHPLVLRHERPQHLDRRVRIDRAVALPAHLPAPPPRPLQQEHVVEIVVRPHRPAVRRVADHEIVGPRRRQERKPPQDLPAARDQALDAVDQQRPAARRQHVGLQRAEGAVVPLPPPGRRAPRVVNDQARPRIVARRQREERVTRHDAAKAGDRLPHQQRPLLPVRAQERRGRQPTQQRTDGLRGSRRSDAEHGAASSHVGTLKRVRRARDPSPPPASASARSASAARRRRARGARRGPPRSPRRATDRGRFRDRSPWSCRTAP